MTNRRVDFGNAGGRARFDAVAKPLLRRLPHGSYRETTLELLRGVMGLSRDVFVQLLEDAPPPVVAKASHAATGKRKTVVQKVINLALHYPRAAARVAGLALKIALRARASERLDAGPAAEEAGGGQREDERCGDDDPEREAGHGRGG